jgi:hypothetical protein
MQINKKLRSKERKMHGQNVGEVTKRQERVGKVHPCTGTEALYRPYGPQGE